jgi:hypothetical protein
MPSSPTPIACSLTDPEMRERLDLLWSGLFAQTRSVREDATGFTFTFDNTDPNAEALLNVVLLERQCCPFLHFNLTIKPQPEELAIHIGGTGEARTFVAHTFVTLVP